MASLLNWLTSLTAGITAPKKDDDVESAVGGRQHVIELEPAPEDQKTIGIVSYTKELTLFIYSASLTDARQQTSASLRYDEDSGSEGAQTRNERVWDKTDCIIKLSDLITPQNYCHNNDENDAGDDATRWKTKLDSERAVVIEIAIKVDDERWDPHQHYLRVQANDIPALQQNTVILGDREMILAQCMSGRPLTTRLHSCGLRGVSGWCYSCNPGPNMITVYQMPLINGDLFKYAAEILSSTGSHGHVYDAPGVITTDENERVVSDTRLELSSASTIARDLWQQRKAVPQSDRDMQRTVIFANHSDWNREHKHATQTVLVNVPYADLKRATIRIGGRGINTQQTLKMRIVAQCLGVYE